MTRPADFRRVRDRGRCWSSHQLVLCRCKNEIDSTRVGFSVSKRIGNAVVRNRVKRQLRHAVQVVLDVVDPGWDIVVIARQGIVGADYWDLVKTIEHLLRLAKLLRSLPTDAQESPVQASCGCDRA